MYKKMSMDRGFSRVSRLYLTKSFFPSRYDVTSVESDRKKDIGSRKVKFLNPKSSEKNSEPVRDTRRAPADPAVRRISLFITGVWKAIVLPQNTFPNMAIIEMFASNRAISPLPSLPHSLVLATTRAKLAARIRNLVTMVIDVFLDNISRLFISGSRAGSCINNEFNKL